MAWTANQRTHSTILFQFEELQWRVKNAKILLKKRHYVWFPSRGPALFAGCEM